MKKRIAEQQNERVLRAWHRWHREQLDEVLAGPHAVIAAHVMEFIKDITPASATALLALMRGHAWADVDMKTKLVLLHEINCAISRVREDAGLPSIDDPLPGQPPNVFLTIKQMLFA
jgi:hypothetical protein